MLELLLCSLLTILPDYLYRRYRQGKRIGHEITLYSVWFELRYGIIACLMLTVALITMIFYYHPSTNSATLFYRTVPIVPEITGRVAEVKVDVSAPGTAVLTTNCFTCTYADHDSWGSHTYITGTSFAITGGGVSRLHLIFARVIEDGQDRGAPGRSGRLWEGRFTPDPA